MVETLAAIAAWTVIGGGVVYCLRGGPPPRPALRRDSATSVAADDDRGRTDNVSDDPGQAHAHGINDSACIAQHS